MKHQFSHAVFHILCLLSCLNAVEYRSFDGTGNNLLHPLWGSVGEPHLHRSKPVPRYTEDGTALQNLPNPRNISNMLNSVGQKLLNPRKLSDLHTAFGQFIAHDLTFTPTNHSDPLPIPISQCDADFDAACQGNAILPFFRSSFRLNGGVRHQVNAITSYLDGSVIYGSDEARAKALRSFADGKMLMSPVGEVPLNTAGIEQSNPVRRAADELRMTGDVRGNVTPQQLALHSLFLRDHNRYCDQLKQLHPHWNDETLYQEARRCVVAHLQHITYNEYLPALLGEPLSLYAGYDPSVNAQTDNLFTTSSFRYGHPEVNSEVLRLDENWMEIPTGHLQLQMVYFNPAIALSNGIEPLLRGMIFKRQAEVSEKYNLAVRNHLFENPGKMRPFDLEALSIQRGRDHGLPMYNDARISFGLPQKSSFEEISSNKQTVDAMRRAYRSVDETDVIMGSLVEDEFRGNLGELMTASVEEQFHRIRAGDRFWYENDQFNSTELEAIKHVRLVDIITRNTNITYKYRNVFFTHDSQLDGGLFPEPPVGSPELEEEFTYSFRMAEQFVLYWSVDHVSNAVRFAALAKTNGWMGIGFSRASDTQATQSDMADADMVIGRMHNTEASVEDYYSFELGIPSLDVDLGCTDDLTQTSLELRQDGTRVMRFTKPFITDDAITEHGRLLTGNDVVKQRMLVACDTELAEGKQHRILFAINAMQDELAYHGATRGVVNLVLIPAKPASTNWKPIIIGSAVGACLVIGIAAACGWYLWRATAEVRMMRKVFSDDNVAQECAEAIACFDLDSVAWLKECSHPSKIQKSFIKIMNILTEVKPYIPDRLLQGFLPNTGEESVPVSPLVDGQEHRALLPGSTSVEFSIPESVGNDTCSTSSTAHGNARQRSRWSQDPHCTQHSAIQPPPVGDISQKRCVYMLVHIRFPHELHHERIMMQEAARVIQDVISIAKANSAIIDQVTIDTVAVHWGVSNHVAEAPLKATTAALSMANMSFCLSPRGHGPSAIRIVIVQGLCCSINISAAGHRFFAIGGRLVQQASNLWSDNAGCKLKCNVLIGASVHQQVQYQVECMPRIIYGDTLFWQPLRLQEMAETDEWMYELKSMHHSAAPEGTLTPMRLEKPFRMALGGSSCEEVREEIIAMRAKYGAQLNQQDNAALDELSNYMSHFLLRDV